MTENNHDKIQEAVNEASKRSWTVLAGVQLTITAPTKWDADRDARNQFSEMFPVGADRAKAQILQRDNAPAIMDVPDGLSRHEAEELLAWAQKNADRGEIDWDELTTRIKTSSNYGIVRDNLRSLSVDGFVCWLMETSRVYRWYEASPENLEQLAGEAEESFWGSYSDVEEFTREYYEESGALNGVPSEILEAVDWRDVWDCALAYDITRVLEQPSGNELFFRDY